MVLEGLSASDLYSLRKMKYPKIINCGVRANVLELAGAEQGVIARAGYFFLINYRKYAERLPLNADQLKKIRTILPSVSILSRGAKYRDFTIRDQLNCRSAMQYIADDFPHMNDLLYTDFVLNFDERLEAWKINANPPFGHHYDLADVQSINASECHPSFHSWWNIGENVTHIQGVTIEESKAIFERQYREWMTQRMAAQVAP